LSSPVQAFAPSSPLDLAFHHYSYQEEQKVYWFVPLQIKTLFSTVPKRTVWELVVLSAILMVQEFALQFRGTHPLLQDFSISAMFGFSSMHWPL